MFRKINIVIYLFMSMALVLAAAYLRKYFSSYDITHLAVSVFSTSLILFLAASLGKSAEFKNKLIIILVATLLSTYVAELLLNVFPSAIGDTAATREAMRAAIAGQIGVPFDKREKWERVRDLRKQGETWYPGVPTIDTSSGPILLKVNGNVIFPLGMVGGANVVLCNESGYWVTFASDEYGYNNPFGIWQQPSKIDNAFVGDSFTVGHCAKQGEGFVDRIREQFPRTINLGNDGSGPLVQLARIKEYLKGRTIAYVFWVYFEGNDLRDLFNREMHVPILMRYLNDDFSQDIISNQEAINSALISFIEHELQEINGRQREEPRKIDVILSHVILRNIRLLLFQMKRVLFRPDIQYDLRMFREVMRKAKLAVENNKGKLVFVYLPDYYRYGSVHKMFPGARMKDDVIAMVSSLDIDVIDIDLVFRQLEDPTILFPFRVSGHYNTRGHSIVADEILRYLNENKKIGIVHPIVKKDHTEMSVK